MEYDYLPSSDLRSWRRHIHKYNLFELQAIRELLDERIGQLGAADKRNKHIIELGLSKRSYNALFFAELYTVADIVAYGLDKLELVRNAGPKSVREIRKVVTNVLQEAGTAADSKNQEDAPES